MPHDQMANPAPLFPYTRPEGLPDNCVGDFSSIAQYLEWSASQTCFQQFKPAAPQEWVYFIGSDDGPVKIGLTNNVGERLRGLQTASPIELKIRRMYLLQTRA